MPRYVRQSGAGQPRLGDQSTAAIYVDDVTKIADRLELRETVLNLHDLTGLVGWSTNYYDL